MRESRKSQLMGAFLLIGITLISLLLLISLNGLQWPIGSAIGKIVTSNPSVQTVPDGILIVNVQLDKSIVAESGLSSQYSAAISPRSVALQGIQINVVLSSEISVHFTAFTTSAGRVRIELAPGSYSSTIVDWRFSNLSIPVQIYSGQVTFVNAVLNATAFQADQYNIADPYSSGWALSWQQMNVHLPTSQSLPPSGSAVFIDTTILGPALLNSLNRSGISRVSLSSATIGQSSEWLNLQIPRAQSIESIKTVTLLTLVPEYTISVEGGGINQ